MFCVQNSCGTECASTAKFCHHCGQQVNVTVQQSSKMDALSAVDESGAGSTLSRPDRLKPGKRKIEMDDLEDRQGYFAATFLYLQHVVVFLKSIERHPTKPSNPRHACTSC